jgi:cystathionine gamma-lyase
VTDHTDATRTVHAGLVADGDGTPLAPPPVLAAALHLAADPPAPGTATYGRSANPTWEAYERALGELEGGEAVVFASGMAAVAAVVIPLLGPGDVLVVPDDGYPGVRTIARDHLGPRGVVVREVGTSEPAIRAALDGAALLWVETPTNPGLDVCDLRSVADAAHAAGAVMAVDNTLATPLGQRPLELGADLVVTSGSKALSGHGDVLIGHIAARDPARAAHARSWRTITGAVPGPWETWLAHRSLATLDVRLERQCANALALAQLLSHRDDVTGVRYPGLPGDRSHAIAARQMARFGPVLGFELRDAAAARRFLSGAQLVIEATSFGGVQTTGERRARWGTDGVSEGFVRLSAGIEDPGDLCADVARALDAARAG